MSLIPYLPAEREIVLRHGSAVVVYDPRSKQLSLRDASRSNTVEFANCPYCHRPLREESPDNGSHDRSASQGTEAGFMNPAYFRMLHHSTPGSTDSSRPPSPHRQLQEPLPNGESFQPPSGAEFVGSVPAPPEPHGISSTAFSQGYFKSFFVEEGELGRGGKGVVLLVRHILDGVPLGQFACKRVPVGDDHEWLEKVLVEVQLLQNLSHQNLVSYRHVWLEDYKITTFGPSVPCAFILQQYCNAGDLHHYILNPAKASMTTESLKERIRRRSKGQADAPVGLNAPKRMAFDEIYSFFRDITSGLEHLHANGYIHRDLKPSNCLLHRLGNKTRVLVSDFGEVQVQNSARKSTGATGTISYCAPEVLRLEAGGYFGNFSTKSDIFSLGMILYFMCFGRLPYQNADDLNEENEDLDLLRAEITAWAGFNEEARARSDLPEQLYRFLKRLLSLDPDERPSAEDILKGLRHGSSIEDVAILNDFKTADDSRSRISPIDTPSPSPIPARHHPRRAHSHSASGFLRPGPSKLRPSSEERSPSPRSPAMQDAERPRSPLESSIVLHPRKTELEATLRPESPTRLMLLPPPTMASRLMRVLVDPITIAALRMLLFLLKIFSVSRTCSPYAVKPILLYPVLGVAALDFLPVDAGPELQLPAVRRSFVLFALHVAVVITAARFDSLCVPKVSAWDGI